MHYSDKSASHRDALIIKFGQIGDVIMAIPAVHQLYQQGYRIDWICGHAVYPLLQSYSWIHPTPIDQKAILAGNPRKILRLWRKLWCRRYDLCACLYYDRRYRFLALPVRAGRYVAFSQETRGTRMLPGRQQIDEYARILLAFEEDCRDRSLSPIIPDRLPEPPLPLKNHNRRIAIVPGGAPNLVRQQLSKASSEQTVRRWPIENYLQLAEQLLQRDWELILLGGPEDSWVSQRFHGLEVTDCIGKLSLPEVVRLCDLCDAVISHDTGPMHLAGLSSTCLIGIFGPTDPGNFLPRRPSVVGIWGGQGFACRPCYDGRDFAPCTFNGCMHQVTPELVLHELDRLLEERDRGEPKPWRIVCPEGTSPAKNAGLVSLPSQRT